MQGWIPVVELCRSKLNPDKAYLEPDEIGWVNGQEDLAEDILKLLPQPPNFTQNTLSAK